MQPPLDGCRVRLARADEHLAELRREMDDYFATTEYGFVGEYRGPQREYVYWVHLPPAWPARWGLLVSDFAHQLRATLDNLMSNSCCFGGPHQLGGPSSRSS